jgi:hypothetical protein
VPTTSSPSSTSNARHYSIKSSARSYASECPWSVIAGIAGDARTHRTSAGVGPREPMKRAVATAVPRSAIQARTSTRGRVSSPEVEIRRDLTAVLITPRARIVSLLPSLSSQASWLGPKRRQLFLAAARGRHITAGRPQALPRDLTHFQTVSVGPSPALMMCYRCSTSTLTRFPRFHIRDDRPPRIQDCSSIGSSHSISG